MADIISNNPQLKKPILCILGLVGQAGEAGASRREVESAAKEQWDARYAQAPATVVEILVRKHALVEQLLVNGEPYEGTLEDVQLDESVPDDAEAREVLFMTEKGSDLLQRYEPARTLAAIFDERPQYADVYRTILWACENEGGCTRPALEEQIRDLPQLQPDPASGQTRVYPQYFIDALETAGGIVWDGAWRTTEAGHALVAA